METDRAFIVSQERTAEDPRRISAGDTVKDWISSGLNAGLSGLVGFPWQPTKRRITPRVKISFFIFPSSF
jgi:hypothetical protein